MKKGQAKTWSPGCVMVIVSIWPVTGQF